MKGRKTGREIPHPLSQQLQLGLAENQEPRIGHSFPTWSHTAEPPPAASKNAHQQESDLEVGLRSEPRNSNMGCTHARWQLHCSTKRLPREMFMGCDVFLRVSKFPMKYFKIFVLRREENILNVSLLWVIRMTMWPALPHDFLQQQL